MAATKRIRRIRKDITGKRFGRWTVLSIYEPNHKRWVCSCDCGAVKNVLRSSLVCGESKSCGCWLKELCRNANTTHGHSESDTYHIWRSMLTRCYATTNPGYARYGGRGIVVCPQWRHDFTVFLRDMGPRPPGKSIDRINNDGPYSPENCRWATAAEQNRNQRSNKPVTWDGLTMVLADWEERLGLPRKSLTWRRDRGWTVERMFTQPFRKSPTRRQIERHAPT